MAWSVDRLGRSLRDLIEFLSELHALGIDLYLRQQGLDTTTPSGRAMFQMMGVFAEFERAMIAERVRAGLARARANGTRLGRPRLSAELAERIASANGSVRQIAAQFGVGVGTVGRVRQTVSRLGNDSRARSEADHKRTGLEPSRRTTASPLGGLE
jgi:DNA invertase Pin-like site-specific DNA recombinase